MKQLYIADPSEHKFLVKEANRPSTFSNILDSVLGTLPGFHKRQNNASPHTKKLRIKNKLHLKFQQLTPLVLWIIQIVVKIPKWVT